MQGSSPQDQRAPAPSPAPGWVPEELPPLRQTAIAARLRVIVAEDDQELRALICEALTREGYDVAACRDGIELVDRIEEFFLAKGAQRLDLIITDIRMPMVTGMEVLEAMHEVDGFPAIVLITAFGTEDTHRTAMNLGVARVFDKPFEIPDLVDYVLHVLPPKAGE